MRTGPLTVVVAAGLAAAVALSGTGRAGRPDPRTSDASAWLDSAGPGVVSQVSGPAARVGATVALPGTAGHRLRVVHAGHDVYVIDDDRHTVRRVDAPTQRAGEEHVFPGPITVIAAGGLRYLVAPLAGTVTEVDPATLAPRGTPVVLAAPLGAVRGLDDGTVWAQSREAGTVSVVRRGAIEDTVGTAAGQVVSMTVSDRRIMLLDQWKRELARIGPDGAITLWPALPAGGPGPLLVPDGETPGAVLPIVDAGAGRLLLARADAEPSIVALGAGGRFGPPALRGDVVHVPDAATGSLLRYDLRARAPLPPLPVAGYPAELAVTVRGGQLWANEPYGPHALVVDDEAARPIVKYTTTSAAPQPRPVTTPPVTTPPVTTPPVTTPPSTTRPEPSAEPRPSVSPTRRPPPPKPSPQGPRLTVPVTYRVAEIRSYRLLEGRPAWNAANRQKVQGSTWSLESGGGVTFWAPGIDDTLVPARGTFRTSGARVTAEAHAEWEIPGTAVDSLAVAGTITLGTPDVMTVTYTARAETWAVINGQEFHSVTVNRYTATVVLAVA